MGFADLETQIFIEPRAYENFELFINGVILPDGSVEFQCQYNTTLFDEETVAGYFESYEALLRDFVKSPNKSIRDLRLLSVAQQQQQIVDWNNSDIGYPEDSTVYREFTEQASRTPDSVAVSFQGQSLTFRQLDEQSNQFARYLQANGVEHGDLVGICVERSEQMLGCACWYLEGRCRLRATGSSVSR